MQTVTGAVLALARWGGQWGATIPAGGPGGGKYAAELRILLVYLSESLGRLGQNGGATFFIGEPRPPPTPRRTTPDSYE